jgi:hypothetical protein
MLQVLSVLVARRWTFPHRRQGRPIADFTDHLVRRTPILACLINEYHQAA